MLSSGSGINNALSGSKEQMVKILLCKGDHRRPAMGTAERMCGPPELPNQRGALFCSAGGPSLDCTPAGDQFQHPFPVRRTFWHVS